MSTHRGRKKLELDGAVPGAVAKLYADPPLSPRSRPPMPPTDCAPRTVRPRDQCRPPLHLFDGAIRRVRPSDRHGQRRRAGTARTGIKVQSPPTASDPGPDSASCREVIRNLFPVGTLVSERPPDSSERAQFGHSAPTSGV